MCNHFDVIATKYAIDYELIPIVQQTPRVYRWSLTLQIFSSICPGLWTVHSLLLGRDNNDDNNDKNNEDDNDNNDNNNDNGDGNDNNDMIIKQ